MVIHAKFLGDDADDDGRSPDACLQTIGDRTAIQEVLQLFLLLGAQARGSPRAVTFQQSLFASLIPLFDPQRNGGTMHFQRLRDLTDRVAFDAQSDGVEPLGHARLLVLERLAAQLQQ